jgi:hypothetical protein
MHLKRRLDANELARARQQQRMIAATAARLAIEQPAWPTIIDSGRWLRPV